MKIILFLLIIGLTSFKVIDNKPKCKKFKTGKYELNDEEIGSYVIERNDSIQIETNKSTGLKSKYKISWVNDCVYQLAILEGSEELLEFYKGRILSITIVETQKDSYTFEARLEGYDFMTRQNVNRVK